MIKQLRIKNFKGWQDTGVINMAPLTVFFGTNSSGKSSIGHLLLMLKQTMDNPDSKTTVFLGGSNSPVQFGTLQNLTYRHDPKNRIEFWYLWDLAESVEITDTKYNKEYRSDALRFTASIGITTLKTSEVDRFSYEIFSGSKKQFTAEMRKDKGKSSYTMQTEGYHLAENVGRPWKISSPVKFYGFPDEVAANYQNASFVQTLNHLHTQLYNYLYYLGPMRRSPERSYLWSGDAPGHVGYVGENTIHAILAAKDRKMNMGKGKSLIPFHEIIAEKLKAMGLIEDFSVSAIAKGHETYEVKVRTKGSMDEVGLPDVGFGVSQVLPVLVQMFYVPKKSIIIMEQPEIHLHPKAQAALADVMIDAILARENGVERGIQLIIETHSEHFLRRLQRRIAENVISTNQCAAYFADTSGETAKLEALQIDQYGNIQNWPEDFFGDEMGDIAAQSLAAMKKREAEGKR